MAALASDWLKHFQLLWNRWTEFNESWQEARSKRPLPIKFVFLGRSEKQDGRPGLWLDETFSTSLLKPLNGIQRNLIGSKISMSSTKFVFLEPIGETRWPPRPLIGWDIFDFSSETAKWNSTKLDRKQGPSVLYQICVFRANRKNKMASPVSDWLRKFSTSPLKIAECNSTKLDTKQDLNVLYRADRKKQDGRPGLWLAETFSTSSMKSLNGIQQNLTGSKISTSSTKFVFLSRSEKQDGRPGLWLGEIFSTSALKPLNGIQRNLIGSKISTSSTKFVFLEPIRKKQDGRPGLWLAETFVYPQSLSRFRQNFTGSNYSTPFINFVFGPFRQQRWSHWLLIGRYRSKFASAIAEWILIRNKSTSSTDQVYIFRVDLSTKMAILTSDSLLADTFLTSFARCIESTRIEGWYF